MEWVEGQYQQCAYGGKMLGGHWEKKQTGQTGQVQSELSATLPSMEVIKIFKMQMRWNGISDNIIF